MSPVISITIPTKMATAIIMAIDIPCELFTAPQIVSLVSPSPPTREYSYNEKKSQFKVSIGTRVRVIKLLLKQREGKT